MLGSARERSQHLVVHSRYASKTGDLIIIDEASRAHALTNSRGCNVATCRSGSDLNKQAQRSGALKRGVVHGDVNSGDVPAHKPSLAKALVLTVPPLRLSCAEEVIE